MSRESEDLPTLAWVGVLCEGVGKQVVIVRGLPGSGKTTYIRGELSRVGVGQVYSPDLYFYRTGAYHFEKSRIGEAHAWCRVQYLRGLERGEPLLFLDYPFVERWQYEDYEWMAKLAGYQLSIVEMAHHREDLERYAARNTHGVPIEVIKGMARKWVPDPRARAIVPTWLEQG